MSKEKTLIHEPQEQIITVIHSVRVLLVDGITMKINDLPFSGDSLKTNPRAPGGLRAPI